MKRMNDSLFEQEIPVYSEKYDIHGVIKDYGVVIKLFFSYMRRPELWWMFQI